MNNDIQPQPTLTIHPHGGVSSMIHSPEPVLATARRRRPRGNPTLYVFLTPEGYKIYHTGDKQPILLPFVEVKQRPYIKPEYREARALERLGQGLEAGSFMYPQGIGQLNFQPTEIRIEAALYTNTPRPGTGVRLGQTGQPRRKEISCERVAIRQSHRGRKRRRGW